MYNSVARTVVILAIITSPQYSFSQSKDVPLEPAKLRAKNVKIEPVTYKAKRAIRVTAAGGDQVADGARLAAVTGTAFQDGVIEVDLTGDAVPGSPPEIRGFVGLAFRAEPDDSRYEAFYVRTKNGRAEDQLQRNHSAQYIANPDFPWQRLREQFPGKYETYVDLIPGEWIKIKIEARGDKARLYVNGADQPTLIVNDLKHGVSKGAIALWVGPGTMAHFSSLRVMTQ